MSELIEGISEQTICPHRFRAGGIEGCTAGMLPPCTECNHPDKKIERVRWSSTSTKD